MSLPTALTNVLDGALEFIYSLQPYVEPTVVLGKETVTETKTKTDDESNSNSNWTDRKCRIIRWTDRPVMVSDQAIHVHPTMDNAYRRGGGRL